MIHVIHNPNLPQFRFEWHPETKKVYWMRVPRPDEPTITVQAFVLAEHCEHHAGAFGAVQTWCRGFREGQKEPIT
jgi:hypothetical protein